MKLWLDAHLDPDLAMWMSMRFKIDVRPLREIGLRNASDKELFEAARRFGRIAIMTKDSDFVEMVKRRGHPPHVILLTCGNTSTPILKLLLTRRFGDAWKEIEAGKPLVEIS